MSFNDIGGQSWGVADRKVQSTPGQDTTKQLMEALQAYQVGCLTSVIDHR